MPIKSSLGALRGLLATCIHANTLHARIDDKMVVQMIQRWESRSVSGAIVAWAEQASWERAARDRCLIVQSRNLSGLVVKGTIPAYIYACIHVAFYGVHIHD